MLRVQVSIGQSEVESIRYVILGINVEVYPYMDNWEQEKWNSWTWPVIQGKLK